MRPPTLRPLAGSGQEAAVTTSRASARATLHSLPVPRPIRLSLVALGLAAIMPRRYDLAMRRFAPIFVVGITLLGAAGCSSRVIPCP